MRKLTGVLLSFALLFALAGCSDTAIAEEQTNSGSLDSESKALPSTAETDQEETMKNTILVAYFSATGTTEQVAQQAAEILGADLYEIVPEEPYTQADLAYYTGGRADQEQNDPEARPAISGSIENMSQYDTVLLGYPIWHGQAPRIINTFLENYDFAGKTIVPFCTSHSSGVGSSADDLHGSCPDNVTWTEGMRFAGSTSGEEIQRWLQSVLPHQF